MPFVVEFPFAVLENTSDGEECFTQDGCDCVSTQCVDDTCAAGEVFSISLSQYRGRWTRGNCYLPTAPQDRFAFRNLLHYTTLNFLKTGWLLAAGVAVYSTYSTHERVSCAPDFINLLCSRRYDRISFV